MNGFSKRLSRYTPAFFSCALVNLLLVELAAAAGLSWPARPLLAPATLAVVHLTTVGWLTLLMFGALFQFVPVIANRALPSQRLMLVCLVGFELGVAAMIVGFAGLYGAGHVGLMLLLGGALVLLAVLVGLADLLPVLVPAAGRSLPARCVLAGTGFLLLTLLLGLSFAMALRLPQVAPRVAVVLAGGLPAHLLAGIGGWLTLTAIGVSYKLLPMFMLAPEERGVLGEVVLGCVGAGFAVAVLAVLVRVFTGGAGWTPVEACGLILAAAGVVLYLIDVVRLYRSRRRRVLELHNRAAVAAFAALVVLLPLALSWWLGWRDNAAAVLVVLALGGWLTGLGLTQLYKIVAFLSWLTHYGGQLGRGRVPRVQDLVDEKRGLPRFVLFFAGVFLLAGGAALQRAWLFQVGAALCFLGTLALAHEYWRGWRLRYAQQAAAAAPTPRFATAGAAAQHAPTPGRSETGG